MAVRYSATRQRKRAGLGLIRQRIARQQQQVLSVSMEHAKAMLPVLKQAQSELAARLKSWMKRVPDGELRWTPHSYRAAMMQAHAIATTLEKKLGIELKASTLASREMALEHLVNEVADLTHYFEGTPRLLSFDVAAQIASSDSYIIPRIRSSALRYAGKFVDDIKQRLAVDILAGESVYATTNRLQESAGPRGLVALKGVAGEPGAIVEDIAEGLFARHRYFAERIVRTETSSAYARQGHEGMRYAAQHVPKLQRKWMADGGACPDICAPMDGDIVGLEEPFMTPQGDAIDDGPAHPNCGCTAIPWSADWADVL